MFATGYQWGWKAGFTAWIYNEPAGSWGEPIFAINRYRNLYICAVIVGGNLGYSLPRVIISANGVLNESDNATDTATLQNSPPLNLRGKYWDGTASVNRDFQLFHRMLSTVPESELALQLAGVDYLRIGDRGFRIEKNKFDAGSSVSVDAGATYTIPQGVYYVICGANTSVEVYDDVGAAWVTLIPAGGVGIAVSDGSNARLYNAGTVAESSTLRRVF